MRCARSTTWSCNPGFVRRNSVTRTWISLRCGLAARFPKAATMFEKSRSHCDVEELAKHHARPKQAISRSWFSAWRLPWRASVHAFRSANSSLSDMLFPWCSNFETSVKLNSVFKCCKLSLTSVYMWVSERLMQWTHLQPTNQPQVTLTWKPLS